jgi:hypothetical protein
MAIYVVSVTLPYENAASRFGIFHSNSETLLSPIFHEDEELIAHMFSAEFERRRGLFADYSERAQSDLVEQLRTFLPAVFPAYRETFAPLPAAWQAILNTDEDEDARVYDVSDLLDWYRDQDSRADVCQAAFYAWRIVQKAAA